MEIFFDVIRIFIRILTFAIFIRVLISWFTARPNIFTQLLDTITEPVLVPLRAVVPRMGAFDITPLVAIILLQIIARLLP